MTDRSIHLQNEEYDMNRTKRERAAECEFDARLEEGAPHQQIKFTNVPGSSQLNTPCPHDMSHASVTTHVGSLLCQRCIHFVSMYHEKKHVTCSFHGDHADKAMNWKDDHSHP